MKNSAKIKSLEELAHRLDSLRANGSLRVVHCHGVFDLLHIGHIRHLEQAKRMGDTLVVTVTPDHYVNKGAHRPAFPQDLRAEALASLDCVDYVAINRWPTAVEAIRLLKPDIYVKGSEYQDPQNDSTGMIAEEERAVRDVGGSIAFTEDITFSSSHLINRYLPVFPEEVREYLAEFSSRYSSSDVLRYLEGAAGLRVLVVGETIIDEYNYGEVMGSASKEPILVTRHVSTERFAGGILAIANHMASFCRRVDLVTFLGEQDSHEDLIRERLAPNVNPTFLYKRGAPTIVKRRFVENYLLQKLFEVYVMGDPHLTEEENAALCAHLGEALEGYDLVVVADYGHGMMTPQVIDLLCRKAPFLAVNTQTNAGNRGFNTISKYSRADFVSLTQYELALEERQTRGNVREMVLNVSQKLACPRMLVTLGKDGNVCYKAGEGFFQAPALGSRVVDRIGAGDAVLSVTSLLVAQDAPMDLVAFVGNVAGAQSVATVGNKEAIQKLNFVRHVEYLMK